MEPIFLVSGTVLLIDIVLAWRRLLSWAGSSRLGVEEHFGGKVTMIQNGDGSIKDRIKSDVLQEIQRVLLTSK